ncbi:hypothetical protein [Hyphomicrobium sp.]|uniref:hypothetical protein n=1 Tax=Hyphomicrobium sp. TaxID=82 RepID=UPI000FB679F6|nr:hypothetical protein [Hyphomicrobium sp.]RUP10184.1 MAG: hypothetical protein EKK38_07065 [Hyphomicrobium sp.]
MKIAKLILLGAFALGASASAHAATSAPKLHADGKVATLVKADKDEKKKKPAHAHRVKKHKVAQAQPKKPKAPKAHAHKPKKDKDKH